MLIWIYTLRFIFLCCFQWWYSNQGRKGPWKYWIKNQVTIIQLFTFKQYFFVNYFMQNCFIIIDQIVFLSLNKFHHLYVQVVYSYSNLFIHSGVQHYDVSSLPWTCYLLELPFSVEIESENDYGINLNTTGQKYIDQRVLRPRKRIYLFPLAPHTAVKVALQLGR